MQLSTPVHSKTISNPSFDAMPKSLIALSARSLLLFVASSLSFGGGVPLGGRGTCQVSVTPTAFLAKSSLVESMSMAVTLDAPRAMEREQASKPTAPEPITQTRGLGGVEVKLARRQAWRTTARGSARAAAS